MKSKYKIAPCPYCNGPAYTVCEWAWYVTCASLYHVVQGPERKSEWGAVKAWNEGRVK